MQRYHIISLILLLLSLIDSSIQIVDIGVLFDEHNRRPYQIWSNVPPGRCCTPTPTFFAHDEVPSAGDGRGISATIAGLLLGDIGFVWSEKLFPVGYVSHVRNPGCTTAPWQSRIGPGSFIIKDNASLPRNEYNFVVGVSYISLPKGLPATKEESSWVTAQGISRLSLGGGKWLPDGVTIPFGWKKKTKRETREHRRIGNNFRGTVEWRSPHYYKYPDLIEVDGVNYTDGWRGDLVYKDRRGRVLNLTTFDPMEI
ncbi:MAG: hypothetical protein L6R41_005610 [Letrouitia leprolyta]|nr:MAG: hypothetical protein L6R41_005610 [Letrouitia leprolyta]